MNLRCRVVSGVSRSAIKPAAPSTASFQSHLVAVLSVDSVENDVLVQIPPPLLAPCPSYRYGRPLSRGFFPGTPVIQRLLLASFPFPFSSVPLWLAASTPASLVPRVSFLSSVRPGSRSVLFPAAVSPGSFPAECPVANVFVMPWWWPCSSPSISIHWVWSLSVAVAASSVSWLVNAQPSGSRHLGGP